MISGIKPEVSKKLLWDFIMTAKPIISKYDKDGLGYAAQTKEYGIWGERWLVPQSAFHFRTKWNETALTLKKKFKNSILGGPTFTDFGTIYSEGSHAIIYHARAATSEKTLENVHPFVKDGVALIHNGIVQGPKENLVSTCDSEIILNLYLKHDVTNNPDNIQKVANELTGSFACGVLTKDKNGVQFLDIFRNDKSVLYVCTVEELGCDVFCTDMDIVQEVCKKLKWHFSCPLKVDDNVLIRINAVTGDVVSIHNFKAYSYSGGNNGWRNYDKSHWDKEKQCWVDDEEEEKKTVDPASQKDLSEAEKTPFHYEGEGYPTHRGDW